MALGGRYGKPNEDRKKSKNLGTLGEGLAANFHCQDVSHEVVRRQHGTSQRTYPPPEKGELKCLPAKDATTPETMSTSSPVMTGASTAILPHISATTRTPALTARLSKADYRATTGNLRSLPVPKLTKEELSVMRAEFGGRGGRRTSARYGQAHFQKLGHVGGLQTLIRYGTEHYQEMGRKGGKAFRLPTIEELLAKKEAERVSMIADFKKRGKRLPGKRFFEALMRERSNSLSA